jgi:osmoprotectant transport system permease protein
MADSEVHAPPAGGRPDDQHDDEPVAASVARTRFRDRINAESAIVLFAIPVIVVIGFGAFAIWHATADLDSVEASALGWPTIWQQIWEHVRLTFVAAFFVVAIAVPLGVLLTRGRAKAAAPLVVGIANAGQAAPSVGLIVLFAMWLGSGFRTAVIALTLYAILPVLRNTIVGLQGVDRTLVEAGRGVGMSVVSVLLRIELPLALPVIMAGVRTALVLLVGTATLATFINGGGLGATLQAGISLLRYSVIVWGAVLVALLALLIEWLGRVLELVSRPNGV